MSFIQIHPVDDVLVALADRPQGETVARDGRSFPLLDDIPAKHKVVVRDVAAGEPIRMYGMVVAHARIALRAGQRLSTANAVHATERRREIASAPSWQPPDVSRWRERTFPGFIRADRRVGTRNYWIVVPLVFCENRNVRVMREAMLEELGYAQHAGYRQITRRLLQMVTNGSTPAEIRETSIDAATAPDQANRPFPHVDGVKFLTHHGGCGGSYADAMNLCSLLAGYIDHPNVAGATVLSLGCQKSQIADLQSQLHKRNPAFAKPLLIFEQQQIGSEQTLLSQAIRHTLAGLIEADAARRDRAPLSSLVLGLECGGSDGFSGISANPAIGYCSDLITALGGAVILSEFPELAGCENDLASRCTDPRVAERFLHLMQSYESRLQAEGNGFDSNPSPGNVRDGLITDAMKSAGAARKGGSSPVVDVLDYPEPVKRPGLNLLCTPGGDVESTTAMAGSGANVMLFSTGLGTPTGNPISPVLKVSSNCELAQKMPDIIDCDAGGIIRGESTIEGIGALLLEKVISTAGGAVPTCAELLGQDDFLPWKRDLTF